MKREFDRNENENFAVDFFDLKCDCVVLNAEMKD
jgi:hypothetical protein